VKVAPLLRLVPRPSPRCTDYQSEQPDQQDDDDDRRKNAATDVHRFLPFLAGRLRLPACATTSNLSWMR
jgi:hypothetical protein